MLRKPSREDAMQYQELLYGLALDRTRSGYPTYTDGIKTKEQFLQMLQEGFSSPNRENLLYEENGRAAGWIQFFVIHQDAYLQTEVFNIAAGTETALKEFEAYCRVNYSGYTLYLGFPADNRDAVSYLENAGWSCAERAHNDIAHLDDKACREADPMICPVTKENFDDFRQLHSGVEGDMYWTSERLYQALDNWKIFLYSREGRPAGAVYFTGSGQTAEIFGVDFADGAFREDICLSLLQKVKQECQKAQMRHFVFFSGDREHLCAGKAGFSCVGEYVLYCGKV